MGTDKGATDADDTAVGTMTASEPGNLKHLVQPTRWLVPLLGCVLSGLLLTGAFAPFEQPFLAWLAFVPLLLMPVPRRWPQRVVCGYALGLSHFLTSLAWLNTIGFAAGVLLGLVCAVFPLVWYLFYTAVFDLLLLRPARPPDWDGNSRLADGVASVPLSAARYALLVAFLPAAWVAAEWVRAWVFSGFSWNQLGVSQWQHLRLLRLTSWTGVYGISFLAVVVNVVVAWILIARWQRLRHGGDHQVPWPAVAALGVVLPTIMLTAAGPKSPGQPSHYLRVAAVQGNIPQRREFTQQDLQEILPVYENLTRAAATTDPDLVVWPETAVPAALFWNADYAAVMSRLFGDLQLPMLIGSLDFRTEPDSTDPADARTYNSAFLFAADGTLLDRYDKVHRVPFGEFVPFGDALPWLVSWIGMGRGLTPGTGFNLLPLPKETYAGVNICYEDAYPGISHAFVRRGANLLMTLTNDAWYAESAGARQHMVHAVLRAVENQRPLFRAGNNSDTCLIMPWGEVRDVLADPDTGNRFVRGTRTYQIPVWNDLPITFYTRHGDWFADRKSVV